MIDQKLYRQLLGHFATGITIVTSRKQDGKPVGVTINSFTSVSLRPPLVLFCLGTNADCYPHFKDANIFAVNFLCAKQKKLSAHFAGAGNKHWGDVPYEMGDHGCPLLAGSLGWLVCKKKKIHAGGDHGIFIGEVTELSIGKGKKALEPLLYYNSAYRKLKA
jgi:flavin reductase (DIM6/NTAB) family NADH-FMN oxidoreductase RutF